MAVASRHPSLVLVHPGERRAYQMALAAQESGILQRFVTGTYYKPEHRPYTLAEKLPPKLRSRALRELNRRRLDSIDPARVQSLEWLEFFKLALLRVPTLRPLLERLGPS